MMLTTELGFKVPVDTFNDIEGQVYQGMTRAFDERFRRRPAGAVAGRDNPETKPLAEKSYDNNDENESK